MIDIIVLTLLVLLGLVSVEVIITVIKMVVKWNLLKVTGFHDGQVTTRNMWYFVKSIKLSDSIPSPGTVPRHELDYFYSYLSMMVHSYIVKIDPLYDGSTQIVVQTHDYQRVGGADLATVEVFDVSTKDSIGVYKIDMKKVFKGLNKLYSKEALCRDDIFSVSEHRVKLDV